MKHVLPPLPYDATALEPHLDARTLRIHHGQHHAGYVDGLRRALLKAPPALQRESAGWLLRNPQRIPEAIRTAVLNNAGGHVNHSLLWRSMAPGGGTPGGALAEAIDQAFGSLRRLRARFDEAGAAVFGSGWVWLVQPPGDSGPLRVMTTSGHGNPMSEGHVPILLNDVWEHAYYLKHQNRRADYLKRWWAVVDWSEVSRRYGRALAAAEGAPPQRADPPIPIAASAQSRHA